MMRLSLKRAVFWTTTRNNSSRGITTRLGFYESRSPSTGTTRLDLRAHPEPTFTNALQSGIHGQTTPFSSTRGVCQTDPTPKTWTFNTRESGQTKSKTRYRTCPSAFRRALLCHEEGQPNLVCDTCGSACQVSLKGSQVYGEISFCRQRFYLCSFADNAFK